MERDRTGRGYFETNGGGTGRQETSGDQWRGTGQAWNILRPMEGDRAGRGYLETNGGGPGRHGTS